MSPRLLAGLVTVVLTAPAASQPFNADARPAAGRLDPRVDRAPEMLDLTIRGATVSGRDECVGFFEPAAPDATVDWPGGRLRFTVRSSTDATLAVVDEQGQWHCNDDGEGLAPVVELPGAARGRYAVWVGSFAEGGGGAATLVAGSPSVAATLDADADAQETLRVVGGFSVQEAVERTVTAGGVDAVSMLDLGAMTGGCGGFVDAARPTARVRYTASEGNRLTFRATTDDADPVLLVRTPDGAWLCDDDSGEGVNSALAVDGAPSGDYTVWVGTFGSLARTEAAATRLALSEDEVVDPDMEFGMDGMDFQPTPYSTGTYRPLAADAPTRLRLALGTDDAVSAGVTVQPDGFNPVAGDACRGSIEAGPTAEVTLGGSGPVGITATGDRDLVLLVLTPGGEWFCSDDADGLNPGVQFDQPMTGPYRVWVGAFSEVGESVEATLTAARGEITVTQLDYGMDMDYGMGMGSTPFAEGVYGGQELLVGQPLQTVTETLVEGLDEMETAVSAGGPLENPVEGPTCGGFVAARPTAAVELDGDATLTAAPAADDDLVMVVHTPDGRWICADDANGGPDPMVQIEEGVAGTYSVWIGTFSRRDTPVAATLRIQP